jgi:hypothetical protein
MPEFGGLLRGNMETYHLGDLSGGDSFRVQIFQAQASYHSSVNKQMKLLGQHASPFARK